MGLVLGVTEEVEKVEEEEELSEGEEESLSNNEIPDLKVSELKSEPEKAQLLSKVKPAIDDSSVSSTLGELRFQDE